MKRIAILALFFTAIAVNPAVTLACERCFGAGVDAPAVRAVSASMLVLFALMAGMFGGILSFFRNMSVRASELAGRNEDSTSD